MTMSQTRYPTVNERAGTRCADESSVERGGTAPHSPRRADLRGMVKVVSTEPRHTARSAKFGWRAAAVAQALLTRAAPAAVSKSGSRNGFFRLLTQPTV